MSTSVSRHGKCVGSALIHLFPQLSLGPGATLPSWDPPVCQGPSQTLFLSPSQAEELDLALVLLPPGLVG